MAEITGNTVLDMILMGRGGASGILFCLSRILSVMESSVSYRRDSLSEIFP